MDLAEGKLSSDKHASCSGLPALFGESLHETRNEYFQSRLDARAGKNVRSEKGIYAEMGDILENPILQKAVEKLNLINLEKNITEAVRHKDYPLQGSIDGIAEAPNLIIKPDNDLIFTEDDEDIHLMGKGILEAKATSMQPETNQKPPLWRGVLQVKGLMAITGYSWAAIATLYRSTNLKLCLYKRDFDFENKLKDTIIDFEKRLANKDYYPPVTLKDTSILYPKVNPELQADLDNEEATALCDQITNCKEQKKILDDVETKAQIRLQELMGNASVGINDKYKITWGSKTFRPQPEKTIPAKEGYTIRNKTITVRKFKNE